MKTTSGMYLWPRPNAGAPELVEGKTIHPGTPEEYAKEAMNWIEVGAKLISGCCGTKPEHTAKLVATIK